MIFKLGALAVVPVLAMAAVASIFGPLFLVVDVRGGSADDVHIVVPAPLSVVRAALLIAPRDIFFEHDHDWRRVAPVARRLLEDLRAAPDAELVRVREPGESVSIRKTGNEIRVDVIEARGDRVQVTVPIGFVEDVLKRSADGRLTPRELAASLGKLPRGRLVDVRDGADRVSVRLY